MHRTEAAGSVNGEYVDRNLPSTPGTLLEASDRNTIQEEIANVIERAGLTLKEKATETENQLEAVIFDTDIKRTQPLKVGTGSDPYGYTGVGEVGATDVALATYAKLNVYGMVQKRFGGDECVTQKHDSIIAGVTWTYGAGVFTLNTTMTLIGIPRGARVKSISMSFLSGGNYRFSPVYGNTIDPGSGYLQIASGAKGWADTDPTSGTDLQFHVEYDGIN
jgi:hypothetical protein